MTSIFVSGPSSWNTLVYLDALPPAVSHTVHAHHDMRTFGGTSLGKALNLRALGHDVTLNTQYGEDPEGQLIARLLEHCGITDLAAGTTEQSPHSLGLGSARTSEILAPATERHLNLMTPHGERLSIYLESPGPSNGSADSTIHVAMQNSRVLVMDLSAESRRLLPAAVTSGVPIWTDLHDYDGINEFHQPFAQAADYVFMNNDGLAEPQEVMRSLVARGATAVVCTLGARGAMAHTKDGYFTVDAVPTTVVDTNGAGDAFMSGVLSAVLGGAEIQRALEVGASTASAALRTQHLHPLVDEFFAQAPVRP